MSVNQGITKLLLVNISFFHVTTIIMWNPKLLFETAKRSTLIVHVEFTIYNEMRNPDTKADTQQHLIIVSAAPSLQHVQIASDWRGCRWSFGHCKSPQT